MTINKDKLTRIVQLAVVVLAGLVTVMALGGLVRQLKGQQEITSLLERDEAPDKPDEPSKSDDKDKKKEKSPQEIKAERIAKRHIFSVEKTKKFSLKLMGILGELAYFQGENKGFTVGQSHKGAEIKRIGPDWVELVFDGKKKMLYVFGKGGVVSKPSKSPPKPKPTAPSKAPAPEPKAIKIPEMPKLPSNMQLPPGFKLTAEMIARFKSLSPEMQQNLLEQMPADIREQIEKEL